MKIYFDPITILIIMGIIQGYFFSFLFLTLKKGNKAANKILAALIFSISTSLLSSVLIFTNLYHYLPHFIRLEMLLTFLFPCLLYLYTKALTENKFKLTKKDTIHIFPFLIVFFALIPFFIKDGSYKIEYINNMLKGSVNYLNIVLDIILCIIEWIYIYFIFKLINKHKKSIKQNFSSIEKIDLSWMKIFVILFMISLIYAQTLTVLVLLFNFKYILFYKQLTLFVAIAITYLGYRGIMQKDIFKNLDIKLEDHNEAIKQILNFIQIEKAYLKSNIKITDLENELNIPREKIADVVLEYSGKNFYDFLNIFRIKEAKNILKLSSYEGISTLHIKAGFKSKILFNRIFREHTGLTPLQFIQNDTKISEKEKLTFGIFINSLNNSFCTDILKGVNKFAQKKGINIICFNGGSFNHPEYNTGQKTIIYNLACKNNLDGIISISVLLGQFIKKNELTDFYSNFKNIPIVSIGMQINDISSIKINNERGLKELLIHLIEDHKCKKIAYINGSENNLDAMERFKTYKKILKEHNIKYDSKLITKGDFNGPSGKKAIKTLLDKRKVEFDAIFAANDYMAINAILELEDRGIKVPEDVAVIGFDNAIESRYITNPLTTVTQPSFELGYKSADKLYRIITDNEENTNTLLDTGFIKRVSCGCKNDIEKHQSVDSSFKKLKRKNSTDIKNILLSDIINIIQEEYGTLNNIEQFSSWLNNIYISFINEISNKKIDNFIILLKNIISDSINSNIDILLWKSVMKIFFRSTGLFLNKIIKNNELIQLEDKINTMIENLNRQIKESPILNTYEQSMKLYLINQALLSINDMESFQIILSKELPKIGINSFYLSIYENNENKNFSKILTAFKNQQAINYNDEDKVFPTIDLIPGGIKNEEGICYIIMSLFFNDEELGFVIFESEINSKAEHELLIMSLSSTVKNILLNADLNNKNTQAIVKESNKKYDKLNLSDEKTMKLYQKTITFLENKKIYINPDLTLPDLADELSIPKNHLSFVINKYIGLNFYDFINHYRVEEAKRYLIHSKNINMLEVAFDSGFKSKSTFNKIFKKNTQITPTEFRKKFYALKN